MKKEKLKFYRNAFKYSLLHIFGCKFTGEDMETAPNRIADILKTAYERYKTIGLITTNLILFGLALLLMVGADIGSNVIDILWIKECINFLVGIICLMKFEVFKSKAPTECLKFGFIFLSVISHSFWIITYIFLVIFENLTILYHN